MKRMLILILFSSALFAQSGALKQDIRHIIESSDGITGVAIHHLDKGDTLSVNGNLHFPMQSVFKFPLALTVLNNVDKGVLSLDQKILITKEDLLPNTWSPLREKYPEGNSQLTLAELLGYTVSKSDNNGCDILFRLASGTESVNTYVHSLGVKDIEIVANEEEMHKSQEIQFLNWSTPKAMTHLLDLFFSTDLLSGKNKDFLWKIMVQTYTGPKRIKGLLPDGTIVAHKTGGSGKNEQGVSTVVNDIGIVTLPDGSHFAITVFILNSSQPEEAIELLIARITKTVWDYYVKQQLLSCYTVDEDLSDRLRNIIANLKLDGNFDVGEDGIEQISLAVIDLTGEKPRFGGVNPDNFIYPASVYKMYVAAEVLHQVSDGLYSLDSMLTVRSPNDVDRSREISIDPRPLLRDGDTVTVNYLLDLMITRSDNSAANCLIDLAGRENINDMMHANNWHGSEVTRKFLSRKFEDPGYETIRGTETCALHAADFMYRIYTNQLVNPWVSMQMKALLGRQLDNTKLSTGLPPGTMFYHKTGWYSYWTNDVGIVDDGAVRYVVACFLPLREEEAQVKFERMSNDIFKTIEIQNKR